MIRLAYLSPTITEAILDGTQAISWAHGWLGRFERGEIASYHELTRAEGFTPGYVRSVMQLAFLAPSLVEAFLDGRRRLRGGVVDLLNCRFPLS